MKLNFDFRSIKFKTFLYFMVFAATLMILLWFLQVFFLNNFYGTMKASQTHKVVKDIEAEYNSSSNEKFLDYVGSLSSSYDMYIYVVSYDGKTTYFSPTPQDVAQAPDINSGESRVDRGSDSKYLYKSQIQALNEKMIRGKGKAHVKFTNNDDSEEIVAYGLLLSSGNKSPLIVYVFSPLWPVSSTIKILSNQLVYVTLVSFILASIISLYLSTRLSRPLRKLRNSAKKLAHGEYGVVFNGGHYTEVIELADTLTMTSIELEKSDMIQKDLIANVSHDLRTPLTMIKSYAEMIRDLSGDNPEKREKHLQVIIDETDRLNGLVEDMLSISRMQSGKITLNIGTFNLTKAAASILETYRVMEFEDQYTFNFEAASDFMVSGDEERIKQVISNLVTNAIKFCGEDKTINLSLKKKGRTVTCSVEDHGKGIAPEELEHIWERYYRASSNTVRVTEGSGLGLSICKEILTLHKAEFGVNSTVGLGSTFWFRMNLK